MRVYRFRFCFQIDFLARCLDTLLPFDLDKRQINNLPIRFRLQSNFLIFLQPFHETSYKSMPYHREILYQSIGQSKNMIWRIWSVFPPNPCLNYSRKILKYYTESIKILMYNSFHKDMVILYVFAYVTFLNVPIIRFITRLIPLPVKSKLPWSEMRILKIHILFFISNLYNQTSLKTETTDTDLCNIK